MMLKIAALPPMPRASVAIATAAKPGARERERRRGYPASAVVTGCPIVTGGLRV